MAKTLYTIYERETGMMMAHLDKESVVAIYKSSNPFIILTKDFEVHPYYITAEGGLRKITGKNAISRELKSLRFKNCGR